MAFYEDLYPQIILDYVPCRGLDEYSKVSRGEVRSILAQCLSALTYLHGHKPPIVYRDIKPSNILVERRFPKIYLKFGDFGLAKDSKDLQTM